jgi:hypothetical protein
MSKVRISGLVHGVAATITLNAFLQDNESDPELCARVRSLSAGESLQAGGGAAPLVTISRVES